MSHAAASLAGAQDIVSKKCEACSLLKASFVLVTDSKVRNSLSDCNTNQVQRCGTNRTGRRPEAHAALVLGLREAAAWGGVL